MTTNPVPWSILQKVGAVKPSTHTKSGSFHTILPMVKYEHALAPRACSILAHMKNNCMHQF